MKNTKEIIKMMLFFYSVLFYVKKEKQIIMITHIISKLIKSKIALKHIFGAFKVILV